ncbi:hypothetical protein PICMEDRAFT_13502 [Pichia membranifaciens NRRL Y-2026]|uniref:Peptidase A1 domain-containing protein n=1 Tax=Pichia membranifaciens NRRL Y-2026 TaxID=763406 RepID=A0A1E3NDT1_9ASCO|nr:hypothetical protein PICMEDRAFT_13502 [Pichia membranifaciens NRRL Y-2026]ODQ44295.1 hypothetical protein PICMEDRAFT_13502 [Pichia membranifaciens NRRL Y-2026]
MKLIPGNGYYDYLLQVGEHKQDMGLRIDILQGDVWLPASSAFIPCSATASAGSNYTYTVTSISYTSTLFTGPTTIDSATVTMMPWETQASSQSGTSTSSTIELTVSMIEPVFGRSCASIGVYDLLESAYAAFIDIYTSLEVSVDDATSYLKVYLSDILVSGVWAVDNFIMSFKSPKLETLEFSNVPFVYANFSNVGVGSLAVGISQSENGFKNNFISNFVINGLIGSNSYSLALGANNSTYPQLILGGVDKSLIFNDPDSQDNSSSKMALFDFIPVQDESGMYISENGGLSTTVPAFPIYSWGVTSSSSGQSITFSPSYNDRTRIANYPKPALLDSRHNYNFIPYSTLVELAIELNAYYSSDLGIWLADCSVGDTGTIDMYLGNYTVHMAISNFLNPALVNNTNLVFSSGDPACYLTFLPDYYLGYSLMGTPLLKNIYLAIDNENRQLGISQLQDQLKDTENSSSQGTHVIGNGILHMDVETVRAPKTSFEEDQKAAEVPTAESHFSHGVTPLSQQQLSRTMTITTSTTVDESRVSAYKTVVTVSNVFSSATATSEPEFYAIESGTIPFAQKFVTVTSLTLTIPTNVVFTDTSVQSTEVYISGGEVFLQTNESNGADTQTKKTQSTETDSTFYAFSSLVVSKISSNRVSGAGSHVQPPSLLYFEASSGEMHYGLKVAGYFSALVLCVAVLF